MMKIMNQSTKVILLLAGGSLVLSGCDTLSHTFGLDHYAPREFEVPTNPPLIIPPGHKLVPPKPGQKNPGHVPAESIAKQKLGAPASVPSGSALEDKALLNKMSGTNSNPQAAIDPNIRATVNKEAVDDETLVGKIKNLGTKAKDNLKGECPPPEETAKVNPVGVRDKGIGGL